MIRKILMAAAMVMIVTAASAQSFQIGIRAGVTSENMKVNNFDTFKNALTETGVGYHAGIVGRLSLPVGLYLQPEAIFTQNKFDLKELKYTVKYQSYDIPVLVGWKIAFVRINAGPVINVASKMKLENTTTGESKTDAFNKQTLSYTVGLGVDLGPFTVDARFSGNFVDKTGDAVQNKDDFKNIKNIDTNFKSWTVSVGFLF